MKHSLAIATFVATSMWLTGKEPGTPVIGHEWGTFTSVALDTGAPTRWAAWSGPADLPCFVHGDFTRYKSELSGLVRMETPVIYFYADRPTKLSVNVEFPKGLVTEWYPRATARPAPTRIGSVPMQVVPEGGGIRWDDVEVMPGSKLTLPSGSPNHYFAARNTDAAFLRAGGENEKLLFYRGVGNFAVPMNVRYPGDGTIELRNTGPDSLPVAIVFENQSGKVGYRVLRNLRGEVSVQPPHLTARLATLHSELAAELVAAGLYEKEAAAMMETWRDSWFEEGMRVFYLVPRAEVDRVLPLQISPAPAQTARVFVGRVEVLSPWTESVIQEANRRQDVARLKQFGRFLQPFAAQLKLTGSPAIETARRDMEILYAAQKCVR